MNFLVVIGLFIATDESSCGRAVEQPLYIIGTNWRGVLTWSTNVRVNILRLGALAKHSSFCLIQCTWKVVKGINTLFFRFLWETVASSVEREFQTGVSEGVSADVLGKALDLTCA